MALSLMAMKLPYLALARIANNNFLIAIYLVFANEFSLSSCFVVNLIIIIPFQKVNEFDISYE